MAQSRITRKSTGARRSLAPIGLAVLATGALVFLAPLLLGVNGRQIEDIKQVKLATDTSSAAASPIIKKQLVKLRSNNSCAMDSGALESRRFNLPKFDFSFYKKKFHKAYRSVTENMNRFKLFLACAFRATVSAIKYGSWETNYYLALNHMSDYTPDELRQMKNEHFVEEQKYVRKMGDNLNSINEEPEPKSRLEQKTRPENIELDESSKQYVEEMLKDLSDASDNDTKDSSETQQQQQQQQHVSEEGGQKRSSRKKRDTLVRPLDTSTMHKSFNPFTGPKIENIELYKLHPTDAAIENPLGFHYSESERGCQSEVFVDLRESKCFAPVRDQGICGSCYAFTASAMFEWLNCARTGELLSFSEQYLIDCGYRTRLNGCSGGGPETVAIFAHNYGMELRGIYPYRMRQDVCPYDDDTLPKQMGHIRMESNKVTVIPRSMYKDYIEYTPIYTALVTQQTDFQEYGGGVHELNCGADQKADHAVLFIGHGIQDGQEYWLIRNSYSVAWGEGGYYKLSKNSINCMHETGYVFGSRNGMQLDVVPRKNELNDGKQIKLANKRNMARDLEMAES